MRIGLPLLLQDPCLPAQGPDPGYSIGQRLFGQGVYFLLEGEDIVVVVVIVCFSHFIPPCRLFGFLVVYLFRDRFPIISADVTSICRQPLPARCCPSGLQFSTIRCNPLLLFSLRVSHNYRQIEVEVILFLYAWQCIAQLMENCGS